MAFAAYLITKDIQNKELYIISAYLNGRNKDKRKEDNAENRIDRIQRVLDQTGRLFTISEKFKFGITFSDLGISKFLNYFFYSWGDVYLDILASAGGAISIGFVIVGPLYLLSYYLDNEHWGFTP
ncbi:hypothetical protein ND861_01030 [Leptospira sp. 2 VSF19]|uniref:ABC transmembrane type-1 domain-containing protein n=1 Tax=Leptospira soteropolitanensis TaxID=2950025 RepID=A0AAW5VIP5_9LEPT|nr:hypothetical protein [Leptospira soteropolitanensis]MCW7491227.1 hypothetical protein [Leptospira soteropolitanensis]MCW7498811.1 hypothetical protein [Leptospira soteropolitanensis]MCW7521596.1 hypothetical protein [Leptospira soteropolitanensis]MCW7524915.1 hypothetical protein [Leptospira soteropolitanensis]MCW7528782.1 hypothetical protein [Leptospira soteropolitanensis]